MNDKITFTPNPTASGITVASPSDRYNTRKLVCCDIQVYQFDASPTRTMNEVFHAGDELVESQ